jgi:hypothetical protein
MPSPLPVVLTSGKDLLYPPAYFCLKCILIVQRGFSLAFQAFICHSLITLTPPLLFLYHHAFLLFNSLQYIVILYSYIDELFQCFSFFNIFFPPSASHRHLRQTYWHNLALSHYIYMIICVFMCTFNLQV